MPRQLLQNHFLLLLLSIFASACSATPTAEAPASPIPVPVAQPASPTPAPSPSPTVSQNHFQEGLDRASGAAVLGQSAQSQDDWRLVASRWQAAIDQMVKVPQGSPDHARAQTKVREYRRNLAIARAQANRSAPAAPVAIVIAPPPPPPPPQPVVQQPRQVVQPQTTAAQPPRLVNPPIPVEPPPAPGPAAAGPNVVRVPIVRRSGGTPVIAVTFNNNQVFEMIVDTGASGTLITREMANVLGVVQVGQARVSTASADNVVFPLGYVRSISVGGLSANNVLVAIAGPELDLGLLGHDFFGDYDLTIRQNVVEFRHR